MTIFIGIDISKDKFDVNIKTTDNRQLIKKRIYDMTKVGIEAFITDIIPLVSGEDYVIGFEATGRYHTNLAEYLTKRGFPVVIFNPLETSSVRKWNVRKSKNDKIDAGVVSNALILDSMSGKVRHISPDDKLKLKEMVTIYHRLIRKVSNLKRELRICLNNLCPGYEQIFENIFSATSNMILKKAVKKTKLFDLSEGDILRILISKHNRKGKRDHGS